VMTLTDCVSNRLYMWRGSYRGLLRGVIGSTRAFSNWGSQGRYSDGNTAWLRFSPQLPTVSIPACMHSVSLADVSRMPDNVVIWFLVL